MPLMLMLSLFADAAYAIFASFLRHCRLFLRCRRAADADDFLLYDDATMLSLMSAIITAFALPMLLPP